MYREIVGYRNFHPDTNFNFQLNRWLPFLSEDEVKQAATEISDFDDWKRVMWRRAEQAEAENRLSEAAFLYRAAEFFLLSADPDKSIAYDKFLELYAKVDWKMDCRREEVPYEGAYLPAYVMEPEGQLLDTLVVHGGFDSFAQELIHQVTSCARHGFRVILFEGPGQGYPLKALGLKMTPDWHKPVGAVLDHFGLEECSLLGISLGGCLATRAAAKEPRIKRVIADDALEDFFGCLASRLGPAKAKVMEHLLNWGARSLVNRALVKASKAESVTAWAVDHGMHVSGASDPYDYFRWTRTMNTREISRQVKQDYLLMGAQDDHLVPLEQFYSQARTLCNVRSLTCRLFTKAENASSHCHIGNQGLAQNVMLGWLKATLDQTA
jgi:pimeloyl-ACP methyl ester carboxylesterase